LRTERQAAGTFLRVADSSWEDPFDGSFSMRRGQRWNAKGSFPVVYLNANEAAAQANAVRLLERLAAVGVEAEDLEDAELPVILECAMPPRVVLDVLSDEGCLDAGLGTTYPLGPDGQLVGHERCQPIGQSAWDAGLDGIACRSAALPGPEGEELAWLDRPGKRLAPAGPPRPLQPGRP
jgi:hypothetical protein